MWDLLDMCKYGLALLEASENDTAMIIASPRIKGQHESRNCHLFRLLQELHHPFPSRFPKGKS